MRWIFGLAALGLALAPAATPHRPAGLPVPNQLLGGGSIGKRHAEPHFDVHFTSLRVSPDGETATVHGDWSARCTGLARPVTVSFVARDARIDDNGSFSAAGALESPVAQGTYALSGGFTGRASASGSGSATFEYRKGGQTYACATPSVVWNVRAAQRAVGRPQPATGAAYYGSTSQTFPLVLRVSRDGKEIEQAALLWDATCETGGGTGGGTVSIPIRIGRDGRFAFTGQTVERLAPERIAVTTWTLTGVFGAETVAGTWQIAVTARSEADGSLADSCSTGLVSFAARL